MFPIRGDGIAGSGKPFFTGKNVFPPRTPPFEKSEVFCRSACPAIARRATADCRGIVYSNSNAIIGKILSLINGNRAYAINQKITLCSVCSLFFKTIRIVNYFFISGGCHFFFESFELLPIFFFCLILRHTEFSE